MDKFLAFGGSFLQYVVIFVILVAIAVLGRSEEHTSELQSHA